MNKEFKLINLRRIVSILLIVLSVAILTSCNTLTIDEIDMFNDAYTKTLDGVDLSNVVEDFSLPTSAEGISITYSSENPAALAVDGGNFTVVRGVETLVVRVVVELSLDSDSNKKQTYSLNVIIPGVGSNEEVEPEMARQAWNEMIITLFENVEEDGTVEKDLNLITRVSFHNHPRFSWSSSRPGVISTSGRVLKPLNGNITVELSATLKIPKNTLGTQKDYSQVRKFYFTVLKYDIPMEDVVDFVSTDVSDVVLLPEEIASRNLINQFPAPDPVTGEVSVNVIVIPVEFTDDAFIPEELDKINKAFFGTSEETGWESLRSFYNKSSYGKVNINGTVTTPFNTGMTIKDFERAGLFEGRTYLDYLALDESLKAKIDELANFSQFDGNNDGYIDGVYLVYSAPQQEASGNGDYPPYWTYHNVYDPARYNLGDIFYTIEDKEYRPYGYVWYSYENINEYILELGININAEILVHESGRFFGLPYFYDYAYGREVQNGLGYMDMMYANVGDHGPWSKMVLGWIEPMVVTSSIIVKIYGAPTTGQVVLITPQWNDSYYGEYLLLDFYSPTGLYELQTSHYVGYPVFTQPGVRIYRVKYNPTANFNPGTNVFTTGKLIEYIPGNGVYVGADDSYTDEALFYPGCTYDWSQFEWSGMMIPKEKDELLIRVLEINVDEDYALVSIDIF